MEQQNTQSSQQPHEAPVANGNSMPPIPPMAEHTNPQIPDSGKRSKRTLYIVIAIIVALLVGEARGLSVRVMPLRKRKWLMKY